LTPAGANTIPDPTISFSGSERGARVQVLRLPSCWLSLGFDLLAVGGDARGTEDSRRCVAG